jgi:hypothetical protein
MGVGVLTFGSAGGAGGLPVASRSRAPSRENRGAESATTMPLGIPAVAAETSSIASPLGGTGTGLAGTACAAGASAAAVAGLVEVTAAGLVEVAAAAGLIAPAGGPGFSAGVAAPG